ncbi:MAG: small subunit ribosomal protein [Thermoplasmata archaeon]|jgi:small subunit ribosomal protein S19|nr:small subunit ribosomal protein [Thermoplasmata archaeon]
MAKRVINNPGAARRKLRKAKAVIETRAKKEFLYRGKSLSELQAMPMAEILPLLPSRTRRLYTRGVKPEELKFLAKVADAKPGEVVRTHYRHMGILPRFVGRIIQVHNGKDFVNVTVQPEMIGHRLGEFAITCKPVTHSGVGVGATRGSKHVPLK